MPAIGIDLGGTYLRAALVDEHGNVLKRLRRPTAKSELNGLLADIATAIAELHREAEEPFAIGIGAAGMIDRTGAVRYSPNIPVLTGVDLAAELQVRCNSEVVVDNDANAAAWGELRFGALREVRDGMVITLGTGIGGGVIINGSLLRGAHGFAAEIGHFQVAESGAMCACGVVGHWEAFASGNALGAQASHRYGEQLKGEDVVARAQRGESVAEEVIDCYLDWVAVGCAGLINIFDPQVLAISGGLATLGDTFVEMLAERTMQRVEAPQVRSTLEICAASLGSEAGMIGSAALAMEHAP